MDARKKPRGKSRKRDSTDWRKFEKLVARIEAAAGPRGAIVKSPDKVHDHVAGREREVDATIAYRVGTVPVLIAIECRKRRHKQDITWIEQLAIKKANIGAARTIAVASAGFSDSAIAAAKLMGIELRRLTDVTSEDINSWLLAPTFINVFRQSVITAVDIVLYPSSESSSVPILAPELQVLRERDDVFAKVLTHRSSGMPQSVVDVWMRAQAIKDFFSTVPEDGTHLPATINLKFEPDVLSVKTSEGEEAIASIVLQVDLWKEQETTSFVEAGYHQYASPESVELHRAEYVARVRGMHFSLGLQSAPSSRAVTFDLHVGPSSEP